MAGWQPAPLCMERSLLKRLWYEFLHVFCRLMAVVLFRIRCEGRENVPKKGGALVLSNHQSNLDPVLIGLACDRRLNYLARETLFTFAPFRLLIQSLDAIPIDREGLGLAGLKETLRRLKRGELVLIFPEGTRTRDGEVAPLKPGFSALAQRANVPLLPVGIEGSFAAWPRWQPIPLPATIHIHFGLPILPEEGSILGS
jgi:1-acyl-sn-glycerol-3-phosphate acyltransferase